MKSKRRKNESIKVEIPPKLKSVCDFLEISPSELVSQMLEDLTGESGEAGKYFTILMQLYVSERMARRLGLNRGELEDYLDQIESLGIQLRLHEFDDMGTSPAQQAIEEYSQTKKKLRTPISNK